MTLAEKKALLAKTIEKMEKSQEREPTVRKELQNDRATLARVTEMKDNLEPMLPNSGYVDYPTWMEEMEKQIKTSENSILRYAEDRISIEALSYFVNNA